MTGTRRTSRRLKNSAGEVVAPQALFRRRRSDREMESRTMFALLRNLGPENRRVRQELRDDPHLRTLVHERVVAMAAEDGVDVEEDRPFLAWLIKNLPAIIAMIMELIAGASTGGFG